VWNTWHFASYCVISYRGWRELYQDEVVLTAIGNSSCMMQGDADSALDRLWAKKKAELGQ